MNKFLIVRLSSLGDIIHTLPAFAALRSAHRDAHITWVVEEKGREILELVPGLDRIVTLRARGKKGRMGSLGKEISRVKAEIRDRQQTALDFQGLMKSAWLTWLSRAQKRVGFHRTNLREPLAGLFYSDRAELFPEDRHVIFKNLKLLEVIGIREGTLAFPLEVPETLKEDVKIRLRPLGFHGTQKLVVVNIGAAWETKRWPAPRWADLVREIQRPEVFPLLLWGTEIEKQLAEEISAQVQVARAPFISIREVIALISAADLVVSGDTFALQTACALSRPVVAIFGPTDPKRNGPFREDDRIVFHEMECSYCYRRKCPDLKCLEAVRPDEVAAECWARLKETGD